MKSLALNTQFYVSQTQTVLPDGDILGNSPWLDNFLRKKNIKLVNYFCEI